MEGVRFEVLPQCWKCGFNDLTGFVARRLERHMEALCPSCAAKPAKGVPTDYGLCKPHRGDFDDNDNPLNRWGKLYRPGYRLCHNKDCVEPTHIAHDPETE